MNIFQDPDFEQRDVYVLINWGETPQTTLEPIRSHLNRNEDEAEGPSEGGRCISEGGQ